MNHVISLGGSLVCPNEVDRRFIEQFAALISRSEGSFVVIVGGGARARRAIADAPEEMTDEEKDWLGIEATGKNALEVQSAFTSDVVDSFIVQDPTVPVESEKKVVIAMGWKPGWSTDYDAVLLAENIGAGKVINMSNVTHVYDKDPKSYPEAERLKEMSFDELIAITGEEWSPGLNAPFDPIAAKKARELGKEVVVIGPDLENLKCVLAGRPFEGTTIR